MSAPAVEVYNAGMSYRVPTHQASTIHELITMSFRRGRAPVTIQALDDVSFSVAPGEVLGVVGSNGAGKSTLLKLLARVLRPSAGRVVVRGRVSPLIELGAGFNFELTARENIVLYGALLGRSIQHMRQRCMEIADWAGLRDQVDLPLRTYSSGMVARLAFSIASDVGPDLLLVDEVLAVGDAEFRERSLNRIDGLIASGAAVILVSHSLEDVVKRADRVLFLERGRIGGLGAPVSTVDAYLRSVGRPPFKAG